MGKIPQISPEDTVIAVMGMTGVGKSTFISYFSDESVIIGHTLEACTSKVAILPATLSDGTKLFLADTPGFDDTYKSDTDILREVASWLAEAYKNKIKLAGIIYLHRILDVRLGGSAMKNLRMFKALCGDDGLGSVVLATTRWSSVSAEEGANRERQLCENPKMWKGMIEKGSQVFRVEQGREEDAGEEIIQYLIRRRRPVTLDIQKDLVDKGMTLDRTAAGQEVTAEIEKQRLEYERKITDLRAEMKEAMATRDRERQEEIKEFKAELEAKMKEARENEKKLQADKEELRRQMENEARKQREQLLEKLKHQERMAAREEARLEAMKEQHKTEQELLRTQFMLQSQKDEARRLARELERERNGGCALM
ncbi:P-loop containing nucleoside triphosphate hydrolase protein [Tirmania nivea]|nr:P-loop containing nucleoside triphosphate hydrolase protein [Tirmania nivea]